MRATAQSYSLSRKVMRPRPENVFEAALERIRQVYKTYDHVIVSYSGKKQGAPGEVGGGAQRFSYITCTEKS